MALPFESSPLSVFLKPKQEKAEIISEMAAAPGELERYISVSPDEELATKAKLSRTAAAKPYIIGESVSGYDFDNDYFEQQFGKVKTGKAAVKKQLASMPTLSVPAVKKITQVAPQNAVKVETEKEKIPPNLPFID